MSGCAKCQLFTQSINDFSDTCYITELQWTNLSILKENSEHILPNRFILRAKSRLSTQGKVKRRWTETWSPSYWRNCIGERVCKPNLQMSLRWSARFLCFIEERGLLRHPRLSNATDNSSHKSIKHRDRRLTSVCLDATTRITLSLQLLQQHNKKM